ncbi:MAG: acyl-CoA dehydrogenase [Candidatus Marinimicrobia bacterium]|nr:acyl-CoA dehydrogenase [Candidatus Neomarinimicrobiota bacterium]
MKFNDEHKALYDTVKNFALNEIKPYAAEWEKNEKFPAHELFKKMGDLDLLGITKNQENGGMGLDYSYGMVFAEALGYGLDSGVIISTGVQTDMATPALDRFGSKELKNEFLTPAISGEYVTSIAVSEHSGGSDVAALKTFAKSDADDYIIKGQKMWITNATQADYFCTLVNTSNDPPHKNKSLVIIPAKLPGVEIGEKIDKLGLRTSDTAPVYFDDVRIPKRYRIGEEGEGFSIQMQQFQEERIFLSVSSLIILDDCIKQTIDYCKERNAFQKKIIDNQVIQFRLAELKTEIEALRSLIYRACEEFVDGKDMTYLASMAKLKCGRLIREVSDSCLQYWGGMGFTWENPLSKIYRDGRLMSIGGGTDEIMLSIICKHIGIGKK